jgi:hypothetical protein
LKRWMKQKLTLTGVKGVAGQGRKNIVWAVAGDFPVLRVIETLCYLRGWSERRGIACKIKDLEFKFTAKE